MSKIVIETQYLPSIAFFSFMKHSAEVIIEGQETYQKGSYRNRCDILSSQGRLLLSIPLQSGKHNQLPIREVKIDYTTAWVVNHLRAIKSCYGKSPYIAYYFDHFEQILNQKNKFLFDLNFRLIESIAKALQLETIISISDQYISDYSKKEIDRRGFISPKKKLNINLDKEFKFSPYDQVFSDEISFEPNLSILDLLFCKGPEAILYLNEIKT